MKTTWLGLVLLVASGCGHKVTVSYMAPGQIELDRNAERVLLLDQSRGADRTGDHTMEGLREVLEASHRFDEIALLDRGQTNRRELRALCDKTDCDVVISLEQLQGEDALEATFRAYAPGGRPLDEAIVALSAEELGVENNKPVAREIGAIYARRVAPHEEIALRVLYSGSSANMRLAIEQVEAGHWQAAEELWRTIVQSSGSDREVAKARHNLAVAAEREGRLDRALQLARNADEHLSRSMTSEYVMVLEQRWMEHKRLKKQLPATVAKR